VLFTLAPLHARLSATSSEHVLGATLCLALLFCWLRAVRTAGWSWLGLTLLLFPSVCATRVDMSVQAALVLLWPLARDRDEGGMLLRRRALLWRVVLVGAVAAATLTVAYQLIAVPSHARSDGTDLCHARLRTPALARID
jgi:hypothetical protein